MYVDTSTNIDSSCAYIVIFAILASCIDKHRAALHYVYFRMQFNSFSSANAAQVSMPPSVQKRAANLFILHWYVATNHRVQDGLIAGTGRRHRCGKLGVGVAGDLREGEAQSQVRDRSISWQLRYLHVFSRAGDFRGRGDMGMRIYG